jgi:hypothetical protein
LVNEEKALKAGIKGFLKKPILKNDLAYKIRYILDKEHPGGTMHRGITTS